MIELIFGVIIISIIIAIIWDLIEKKKKRKYEQYQQWKQNSRQQQESIQNYEQSRTQQQHETPNYQQLRTQQQPPTNYQQQNYQQFFPYQRKYLLTRNEYNFYKRLIPIANNYNLQILTKIRLADLVETKKNLSYADSNAYFNKIRSKHIDFALVDNMRVVVLIELDDSSHQYQSRIERDIFVDDVLRTCGYCIIHTYGDTSQIDYTASCYRNTSNQTQ